VSPCALSDGKLQWLCPTLLQFGSHLCTTYFLKPSRATVFVATWIRKRLPYHIHIVALSVSVRYTVYNRTRTPGEYHPTPFAIMKTDRSSGLWTQLPYLNIVEQLNSKKKKRTSWFGGTAASGSHVSERHLVLAMASAFSVDTEDCSSHVYTVDIQEHHKQRSVIFNCITTRGPIVISCRGEPRRNQPFRLSTVQRGATPRPYAPLASSPRFIEIFSED
jgi:hypothetical protein